MSDAKTDLSQVSHDELLREMKRRSEESGSPDTAAAMARLERLESLVERLCGSMAELMPAPRGARTRDGFPTDEELRSNIERIAVKVGPAVCSSTPTDDDLGRSANGGAYQFPPLELLCDPDSDTQANPAEAARARGFELAKAIRDCGLHGRISSIECGPSTTLFYFEPDPRTRVRKLEACAKDFARALAAPAVRILPSLKDSTAVGIEVPNKSRERVRLKELMLGGQAAGMSLPIFMGKDSLGDPLVLDLAKMPHMLIAGTTGSGRSSCVNSIIMSFLYTKRPDELKVVLVAPRMVEMAMFADIPHLACPIVTEMGKADWMIGWAAGLVDHRRNLLAMAGVSDIESFNGLTESEICHRLCLVDRGEWGDVPKRLPYLVIVVDELADLMETNGGFEDELVRITQRGRAVGIHLILATQHPRAKVVAGFLKSNILCRVAFKVASGTDSRVVLNHKGAELLLGRGDMLVVTPSRSQADRGQGVIVGDEEARGVVKFLKESAAPLGAQSFPLVQFLSARRAMGPVTNPAEARRQDPLFDEAVEVLINCGRGSVSVLQVRLKIGYGRASRLVELMGQCGILGEHNGSHARLVKVTDEQWQGMRRQSSTGFVG